MQTAYSASDHADSGGLLDIYSFYLPGERVAAPYQIGIALVPIIIGGELGC